MKIPNDVLQKHLGILGINGSGKTYTAKGCVEMLLDRKERVCVIDPTGVWWGLKSSASGKSGGYTVVVFGGEHADLPISGMHGETIAEAIGTSNTPAITAKEVWDASENSFFKDGLKSIPKPKFSPPPKQDLMFNGDLNGPQRRIVDSLRFWKDVGHDQPSREQVAAVAGYSAGGGAFGVPASKLCTLCILEKPSNGMLKMSDWAIEVLA